MSREGYSIAMAFLPVFCLCFNCAAQVLVFRLHNKLLNSVIWGFCAGFLALSIFDILAAAGVQGALPPGLTGIFLVQALTYLCLGYCYFHFLNLTETARRIRIMRELRENPQGLALNELLARYNARQILERRISRLIDNGQVRGQGGRLFTGRPVIFWMAKIMVFMKLVLLNKRPDL